MERGEGWVNTDQSRVVIIMINKEKKYLERMGEMAIAIFRIEMFDVQQPLDSF